MKRFKSSIQSFTVKEGIIRKGGLNNTPTTPRPNTKPVAQNKPARKTK